MRPVAPAQAREPAHPCIVVGPGETRGNPMIEGGVEPTHRSIASRMRLLSAIVALAALVSACAIRPAGEPAAGRLGGAAGASRFRLTLLPAPGARINARLKPVLELD